MKLLSNMKLGKKIVLSSTAMVAILLCTLLLSSWSMSRIKGAQDASQSEAAQNSKTLEMRAHVANGVMFVGTVLMHEEGASRRKCDSCHESKPESALLAPFQKERELSQ